MLARPKDPSHPQIIASSKHHLNKKVIALGGLAILLVGTIASVVLVLGQQIINTQAWNCSEYEFNLSQTGTVTVTLNENASGPESSQSAVVSVNGAPVSTLPVPPIEPGQNFIIGTVSVPTAQGFTWDVTGQGGCTNTGTYPPQPSCPPITVSPKSGDWNDPDKFVYRNTSSAPVTLNWRLICQFDKNFDRCVTEGLQEQKGSKTLQPGDADEQGYGSVCAIWQVDFNFSSPTCPGKSYVAPAVNCPIDVTPTPTDTLLRTDTGATPTPTPDLLLALANTPTPTTAVITTPTPTTAITSTSEATPTPTRATGGYSAPTNTPPVTYLSPTPSVHTSSELPKTGAESYTILVIAAATILFTTGFLFLRK